MLAFVTPGSLPGKPTCRSPSCCLVVPLSVCLPVCLSAHEADLQVTVLCFVCLSVCLSVCFSAGEADLRVFVLRFVSLPVCVVCQSICMSEGLSYC